MTPDPDWLTALGGAAVGAAFALSAQLVFDRYTRRVERQRYAAALNREIQRLSEKLGEYASSFEKMKDTYDPERRGFPYMNPPSNPIKDDDILIHRTLLAMIGTLDSRLTHDILDFYGNVRTLDETEEAMMEHLDDEEAFEEWIKYRRILRDDGQKCAKKLTRYL